MSMHMSRRRFIQASLAAPLLLSSFRFARADAPGIKISAFADEISPDLDEQIRVCKGLGIGHIELRAAAGKNVLDFDAALRKTVREKLQAGGMGVISIGSPIGKVKLNEPWPAHFDRFKVAVEMAEYFSAPLIRLFSYYPAKGEAFPAGRDEVLRRMQLKADYVKDHPVTLVHENEKGIYGEGGPACLAILKAVNSPKLRCAFDFANFVQAGDDNLKNWELLKPYVVHFHIKDYKRDTKKVVPAGQGDGNLQPILEDAYRAGYRGFFSLEPHLKVAGHSAGETGADLFKVATNALREVCRKGNIPLA
jgi:sugar phosphate isomerase/epimerase